MPNINIEAILLHLAAQSDMPGTFPTSFSDPPHIFLLAIGIQSDKKFKKCDNYYNNKEATNINFRMSILDILPTIIVQASLQVCWPPPEHPFFIVFRPKEHSQYPDDLLSIVTLQGLSFWGSLGPSHLQSPVWRHPKQFSWLRNKWKVHQIDYEL